MCLLILLGVSNGRKLRLVVVAIHVWGLLLSWYLIEMPSYLITLVFVMSCEEDMDSIGRCLSIVV